MCGPRTNFENHAQALRKRYQRKIVLDFLNKMEKLANSSWVDLRASHHGLFVRIAKMSHNEADLRSFLNALNTDEIHKVAGWTSEMILFGRMVACHYLTINTLQRMIHRIPWGPYKPALCKLLFLLWSF
ncbi:hypothetical protein N7466_001150 [Penicillium verhagenii]|uniref:uncharacterized protein n=1 Tax=Penicillium verhagenii TaxID=1562060 RepID=UPI0025451008|nr:uncharacterized protein N7466_001150 [Penicillium verhagenii]KAJ5948135.1 hypothetical protein N7466_001150 [Penicillium verhagenii]